MLLGFHPSGLLFERLRLQPASRRRAAITSWRSIIEAAPATATPSATRRTSPAAALPNIATCSPPAAGSPRAPTSIRPGSASGAEAGAAISPPSASPANSDLFAAGVDFHGVHSMLRPAAEQPVAGRAGRRPPAAVGHARRSAAIERWRSPVLLIHGDDDRNVDFAQSVLLGPRAGGAADPLSRARLPERAPLLPPPFQLAGELPGRRGLLRRDPEERRADEAGCSAALALLVAGGGRRRRRGTL